MDVLIPIAKSNKTDDIVFIDDVDSGLDCDCRCVACDVPLVARKGEVNIHHFAHQAKKIDQQRYCSFNFERSVFWMIRQLLSTPHQINLPSYTIKFQDKLIFDIFLKRVTERHQVYFEKAEFPQPLNKKSKTDVAILTISGYPLAITFCLHSSLKYSAYSWEISQAYVASGKPIAHLEISLNGLRKLFSKKKREYRKILEDIIFVSYARKSWLFHPNEKIFRREFASKIKEEETKRKKSVNTLLLEPVSAINIEQNKEEFKNTTIEKNPQYLTQQLGIRLLQPTPFIQNDSRLPPAHVQKELLNNIKLQQTGIRLKQLIDQLTQFKQQGHTTGKRCRCCYFMNVQSNNQCEFCDSDQLLAIELDEQYFDNIEHKYDCWCFAIYSLECLQKLRSS